MNSVLVTGAGGVLGGELIRQLRSIDQYKVFALTSSKEWVSRQTGDLKNLTVIDLQEWEEGKLPLDEIYCVVHCAFTRTSLGGELSKSLDFSQKIFRQAVSNKIPALINISSRSVYGQQPRTWTEQTSVFPETPYAVAKYSSELLADTLVRFFTSQTALANIRLAGLVGPGLEARTLSRFVLQAINGAPIQIIGGEQQFRYLDIRDAASGIIALLHIPPENWKPVYNLGNNKMYTIKELADEVVKIASIFGYAPSRPAIIGETVDLIDGLDSALFFKDMRWSPRYTIQETIKYLFEYYMKNKIGSQE